MVIFTVITSVAFLFMLVRNINSSIEMKAYKKGEHGEVLYVMEETRTGMKVLRLVCLLLILVVAGLFILDISKFETMRSCPLHSSWDCSSSWSRLSPRAAGS